MKVLHVINDLSSGGAEKLVEEISIIMKSKYRLHIEVLLLDDRFNVYGDALNKNGIQIRVIPSRRIRNPFNFIYLYKYIREGKFDIVHSHLFPDKYYVAISALAYRLFRGKRTKFVTTEHSTNNRRRKYKFLSIIERVIYNNYDLIVSISDMTQCRLLEWIEVGVSNRFLVIPNGINMLEYSSASPYEIHELVPGLCKHNKLIGMVGRFSHQKDHKTLIKAVAELPEHVHLLLIGEGPTENECKVYASSIGVGNRVHFLGFRKDIPQILKTIDVAVLSSLWEGFGLVAIEAMAAGIPVVGTNIDGLKQIINQEDLLFDVGDSRQLAEILNKLISDDRFYKSKIETGLEICRNYDIEKMVDRYYEAYFNLCTLG